MLKYSTRNCSLIRSVMPKYLETDMSVSHVLGRRRKFLLVLPNVPKIAGLLTVVPGSAPGTLVGWNAAVFSQLLQATVTPAHAVELYGSTPGMIVPRSLPMPVPEISVPCRMLIGRPLAAEKIPPHSQPPRRLCNNPFPVEKIGNCQT